MLKSHRSLCVAFSRTGAGLCIYHLLVWSNYYYYYYYLFSWEIFHTRVSWWFLTVVWVTANLPKSSALVSVFWMILIIQLFRWSPLVFLFPSPLVPLIILRWLYEEYQLQLVLSSLSCSTAFSILKQGRGTFFFFFLLSFKFTQWSTGTGKSTFLQVLFFFADYYKTWSSGWDLVIRLYLSYKKMVTPQKKICMKIFKKY